MIPDGLRKITPAHPLIRWFQADDLLALRDGPGTTAARFLRRAAALALRLPARRHVLNLCEDRYHFLLGFAAALLARQVSLLPPSRSPEAMRQISRSYPDTYCLADHADLPAGLPALSIPEQAGEEAGCAAVPLIPGDQVAAIVFTSGSTGLPTAHAKTWSSLVLGAETLGRQLGFQAGLPRAILGTVPPQHMYGLETTVMLPLQWGCMTHVARPVLPADLRSALASLPAPRWLVTTPLHLRAGLEEGVALPAMEGVLSATMPLPAGVARQAEALWHAPVQEIYGCTEGGMIAMRRPAVCETWTVCPGLRILGRGGGAWVEGGHLLHPLRLADRISVLNGRNFLLHGRANDLVKIGGKRASLQALNAELIRIKGVSDGVFCVPDGETGGERLTAFAVAQGLTAAFILAELRKRIDPVFLPRPLYLVEALPRSATGKLPRESLRAFASGRLFKTAS